MLKLSKNSISSFLGDAQALFLESDADISKENIKWSSSDPDIVAVCELHGNPPDINNGVVLTLNKVGCATVSAELNGETFSCEVSVRERSHPENFEKLNYYLGDLHDHTTKIHGHNEYADAGIDFPKDYVEYVRNDGSLDLAVISDHAFTTNDRAFIGGFIYAETDDHDAAVILPGAESEITAVENDRFGIPYKNSGEIVTVNAGGYVNGTSWDDFYKAFERSPNAICVLAHPYPMGFSVPGIWNFKLNEKKPQKFIDLIKGIEMGDGTPTYTQLLYEGAYSEALDIGMNVSVTCSSDSHGPVWGAAACPGKTVIMAPERTKEAFVDALIDRRFYATESGNVKLYYTVNGKPAPATLNATDKYDFHIEISVFNDIPDTVPTKCEIISNGGKALKTIVGEKLETLDLTLESSDARYFYLRLSDGLGRKTWSTPVYTGREPIIPESTAHLKPLNKEKFTVTELESGKDASVLVNGDIYVDFCSELESASYVIDMGEEKEIAALGNYIPYLHYKKLKAEDVLPEKFILGYLAEYRISSSTDGVNYTVLTEDKIRTYSGEVIIPFPRHTARYVKFEAISNVGNSNGRPETKGATLRLSELSLFE